MITFNGFAPNESRSRKLRPRLSDNGHSIVLKTMTRRGHSFRFTYSQQCQCGQKFSTIGSVSSLLYRWEAHKREKVNGTTA